MKVLRIDNKGVLNNAIYKNLEDLRNHTTVIEIPDTERLIIQAY